jgi:hypothetical protein
MFDEQIPQLVFGKQRGNRGVEAAHAVLGHVQIDEHHLAVTIPVFIRIKEPSGNV